MQEELKKFFQSEEGETLIGNIVMKAVDQALSRKVSMEDGKSNPGRVIEKETKVNILDHLAKYLPYLEGAIRGCQSDAAQARNRSIVLVNAFSKFCTLLADAKQMQIASKEIRKLESHPK